MRDVSLRIEILNAMPVDVGNQARMARWESRVESIVRRPPGSDENFSAESLERDGGASFFGRSHWSIVCEEVLDTQFSSIYFARAREELLARGITAGEIEEMRRFAWITAGWLNFECYLWDWNSMDEKDIYQAIEIQYSDGFISAEERDRRVAFARRYDTVT